MKKVGITGGIGAGKTTVCQLFETLGVPIYYADERAKWLMVNDLAVIEALKMEFGEAAFFADGSLNRALISNLVFSDAEKLRKLNAIVHPAVFRDWSAWQNALPDGPYSLREAALLVESGSYKMLDQLIVVTAPTELRIERVMRRDGASREAILARLKNQLPEEEKVRLADFVIKNDGSESLISQVLAIDRRLKS